MGLNKVTIASHHFVKNMMMLAKDDSDNGKHDSIERTLHAYLAYGDDIFIWGIHCCRRYDGEIKRYPFDYDGMQNISNDHLIYSICAFEYSGHLYDREMTIRSIKKGFKGKPRTTIKMLLWFGLLQKKWFGKLFYVWEILDMFIKMLSNKLIVYFIPHSEELSQWRYEQANELCKKHPLSSLLFPTYALKINTFMLDVLPDSKMKDLIHKVMHRIIPKYNLLLKVMTNHPDNVSYNDVMRYHPMTCDRWSVYLNPLIEKRNCKIVTDLDSLNNNAIDKDLLIAMLKRKNK